MLNKYLVASVLGLSFINQAHAHFGLTAFAISAFRASKNTEETKAMQDIEERAQKLQPIKEFTPQDIAMLDRLMDQSPARNILWGTYAEEQGESTVGLREENKRNLRLFMNRDAAFDSSCWSSDVHRPIGYSMPSICNVADDENAPTEAERRLKGQVCAKFFLAVRDPQYYKADKHIAAAQLLAQKPNEGAAIFKEVFGEEYKAE